MGRERATAMHLTTTRLTVLGWGSHVFPGPMPAGGMQPNSLEVMIHQWWGYVASMGAGFLLVVTETAATPRQLRLLNAVVGSNLLGAFFGFVQHAMDNTQPLYWCTACIGIFVPLGVQAIVAARA